MLYNHPGPVQVVAIQVVHGVGGILAMIRNLGRIVDAAERAEELAASYEAGIAAARGP